MNIETVNELITSLESAGELSIREQKFLKLAKAFKHLAAENVALKSFGDKLNDMHNALNGEGTGIQGRAEVACQQVALEAAIEEFDAIETPATDRIVACIKADEEKTVLNDLLRHLDKIDIENLSSPWELSSEVVAFVNSRLLREGADK